MGRPVTASGIIGRNTDTGKEEGSMANIKNIFVVGSIVPCENIESFLLSSDRSLHDADIVYFCPGINHLETRENRLPREDDKIVIRDKALARFKKQRNHWHREIKEILAARKLLIVLLTMPQEIILQESASRRLHTNQYAFLPFEIKGLIGGRGSNVVAGELFGEIKEIWECVSQYSEYEVYFDPPSLMGPALLSRDGRKIIGGPSRRTNRVIFLPAPRFNTVAAKNREHFAKQFVSASIRVDKRLSAHEEKISEPEWAKSGEFRFSQEDHYLNEIGDLTQQIQELETLRSQHYEELGDLQSFRCLLYGTGKPLESAIEKSLEVLGFNKLEAISNDDLDENDGVFESDEGVILIEAEGKNKGAMKLEKLRQLNDKIDIYLSKTGKSVQGVLAANTYRLLPIQERAAKGNFYSDNTIARAKQTSIAMLRTIDLFGVTRALLDKPNKTFAKSCRKAIFDAAGEIVELPKPPKAEAKAKHGKKRTKKNNGLQ